MASSRSRSTALRIDGPAAYWLNELARADKHERDWREAGGKVLESYRDDKRTRGTRVNILWSNTETMKAALLARTPKPDVRRRFGDRDPIGRAVATILERAMDYCADAHDAWSALSPAVDDMLLPGRGVVRVKYEAVTAPVEGMDGAEPYEAVASQKARFEYVSWQDYREQPARHWGEVWWIAFRHLLTEDEAKSQFPDHADKLPLVKPSQDGVRANADRDQEDDRLEVWEVWDREKRRRLYVAKGYGEILAEDEDPYRLAGFWPIPRPLYAVATTDTRVPVPLYRLYQDQAKELNEVTARITKIVGALKRRGVYNGAVKELADLATADDNHFIAVDKWAALIEKGGLQGAFQTEDITPMVQALAQLYQQRAALVQTIYEVTGISDIIRGASDPKETATAQRLKGQFGGLRLRQRQEEVQRFIRDLYRIQGEIIAEHFEPQALAEISGVDLPMQPEMAQGPDGQMMPTGKPSWPDVIRVLRSDKLRGCKVDIETDATVFEDAENEKKARIEFVNALTVFGEKWFPVAAQSLAMAKLTGEVLGFAVRGFRAGRQLEEALDEATQAMVEQASQPKPPDPAIAQAQAEMQIKQQQAQAGMQLDQQRAAADMQLRQQEVAGSLALKRAEVAGKLQIQREGQALKAEAEARRPVVVSPGGQR